MTPTFDLYGPLPTGTVVIEASAGTGKTHAIATLAVRYLAEGVPVDELMMITFGRAATVELRERVRERLVHAVAALGDTEVDASEELTRHLRSGDPDEIATRRERLATAAANFDAATIATTHGFCQQMLAGLGLVADVDDAVTFSEDTSDEVTEVVQDLYVRMYGRPGSDDPAITYDNARRIGLDAVGDRSARLEPRDAARNSGPDLRRRIAEGARSGVETRKRMRRVMDYDDLLVQLRDALTDPETGAHARERVRSRYSVVLVDEFQDTDPVQWQILASTFDRERTRPLILIGDPKQAIYAFRGADVATYLFATADADSSSTLSTNWRSDAPLVRALNTVMGTVTLGDPRIAVREVRAAREGRGLRGPCDTPLRLKVVTRDELPVGRGDLIGVKDARPHVAADVASDIVELLESGTHVRERDGGEHPVGPADIAVLVQRNVDGRVVREALRTVGVPAVVTGTSSVFGSHAATEWLTLLNALEQPHRSGYVRAAALTDFVGWDAERLGVDDDAAFDELSGTLREWADIWSRRGVAALLESVTATSGVLERVLRRTNGDRDLTDLRHIGQALHAEATRAGRGSNSLVGWLQERIAEAQRDLTEEMSRRLESDARAVQIVTVHRAKGLEFPVVYAPYLWDRYVNAKPDPLRLHDDNGDRVLDVGGLAGPGYTARRDVHAQEDAGESLRLAYVALTRARSQLVVHWAPTSNTRASPLHRMLFGTPSVDGALPATVGIDPDTGVSEKLRRLPESDDSVSVETTTGDTGCVWRPPGEPVPELEVRHFDRALDLGWARTSYSGITAGLHEATEGVTSEPEEPGLLDEPAVGAPEAAEQDALVSPMADLPKGAAFGTLVHALLERIDFSATDVRTELAEQAHSAASRHVTGVPPATLADALLPSLATPLGPLAFGRRLADITSHDRIDELEFELPLVGGDTAHAEAYVGQVAELLRVHLPAEDALAAYADDLAVPLLASRQLRGFLTGSIDLVLRVRGEDDDPRYIVVDYKTNWLGDGETLTTSHYRPDRLATAMREAHYPLQALLYSVALHRFLRWRQLDYAPSRHLGGVLYLFVRGMCGPETPALDGVPHGVFSWAPPSELIVTLSDLLDRGAR